MKKFKELKSQLFESEYMDGGALGQWPTENPGSVHSDYGVHRVESEEQIQRLQAFINSFFKREVLEPRALLSLFRVKLNLAGYDFDFNNKTEVTAEKPMVFHIKRFGGTFGFTPTHDLLKKGFQVTDGIEETLGGDRLVLVVDMKETDSGLFKLKGVIQQVTSKPHDTDLV